MIKQDRPSTTLDHSSAIFNDKRTDEQYRTGDDRRYRTCLTGRAAYLLRTDTKQRKSDSAD